MADWKRFHEWEERYKREKLAQLSVSESFMQYCQLMEFATILSRAGNNPGFLTSIDTNPHLKHLIQLKRALENSEKK